ncbi:hemicentin-1-like isoform X2 [Dreissena polymorpha]|uniref:hemicentin-1-like isoform X2 n=1 Tax=Dreissena polymorpha TaxID=45954 RepID=UPI0022644CBD|nr:hemicentin-1-like isoform X2 [Dreissena polymorpha]
MFNKAGIQATVYVYIIMMIAGVQTGKLQILRGQSASMACFFREWDKTTLIRWRSKEGILTSGKKVYKHENNIEVQKPTEYDWTLVIKKADDGLAGNYTCETENGTVIAQYTLEIIYPPRIIQDRSSATRVVFEEGSTPNLTCHFSGVPTPTVCWYRGLRDALDTGITGEILRLPSVSRYASDTYICEGKNFVNSRNYTIDLQVNFPVEVDVMEEVIKVQVGAVVSLVCAVEGQPIKEGYWRDPQGKTIISGWKFNVTAEKDGDFPVQYITATSQVGALLSTDFGDYTCVGEGDSNSASKVTRLVQSESASDVIN